MNRLDNERGAILYLVALGMAVFLGIAAMAIDYGIWFVARSEAQRAAEAGAHAGAGFLMHNSLDEDGARLEAENFAELNAVRGVTTDVFPDADIDVILDSQKVRVRVQRSDARSNPLGTIFARAMGIDQVDIGAAAAAQAWPGISAECILPFALPDRFDEWDEAMARFRERVRELHKELSGTVTFTGDGNELAYWNRYVAVAEMGGLGSVVMAPLRSESRVFGVLVVARPRNGFAECLVRIRLDDCNHHGGG